MKKTILITLLLPVLTFGQWNQVGANINGQVATEQLGTSSSLNTDGTVLAIGAPNAFVDSIRKGKVRVYEKNGTSWIQKGSDINGTNQYDQLGESVSISSDGNIVSIGAPGFSVAANPSGYTRVFEWNGTNWIQKGTDIIGEGNGDSSGGQVSLNANGSIVAIGASSNNGINGTFSGHCRIYEWNGSSWSQKGADIDGEAAGDSFGTSISINSSGTIVAAGASGNDGAGNMFGHVRVFEWNGSTWMQKGVEINGDSASQFFGISVSIDGTGNNLIAAGTIQANFNAGAVKAYTWNGSSWVQKGQTIVGDTGNDSFGSIGLDINDDGSTFIAGGLIGNNGKGYAKVYKITGSSWVQNGATINGDATTVQFGRSVSINSSGNIVAVGTPNTTETGNGINFGLVRVYEYSTLSISDTESTIISVYPNPSSGMVKINSEEQIELAHVYDMMGKEILSLEINSYNMDLDLTNYPNGKYTLKLQMNSGVQTYSIVKNN